MARDVVMFCPQFVTLLEGHLKLAAEVTRSYDLSLSEYLILTMQPGDGRRLRVSDYAATLSLKTASVAKALQRLEDAGLLLKTGADEDGRVMEMALTSQGCVLAAVITQDISALFERVFWRSIPENELETLKRGIAVFLESIGIDTNNIARESASMMTPQFLHSPYQTVRRWKRELEGEPVSFVEYRVLSLMRAQRVAVPSDAARQLCLKRSQISVVLKSLMAKGLARKAPLVGSKDARSRHYVPTGKGSRLADQLDRRLEMVTEAIYSSTNGREAGMLNAWHMRMYFDFMESVRDGSCSWGASLSSSMGPQGSAT